MSHVVKDLWNKTKSAAAELKNDVSKAVKNTKLDLEEVSSKLSKFPVDVPESLEIEGRHIKLVKLLDEGGFSYVFLVKDTNTGEPLALKRLLIQDPLMYKNAMREIEFMRKLSPHENIIKLVGTKSSETSRAKEVYILMELAKDSLPNLLQRKLDSQSFLSEDQVLRIFYDIVNGVALMHAQNPPIIHRDLKVENVLYCDDGKYKLCDFGSATTRVYQLKDRSEILEAEEDVQKNTTPSYQSPEMADLYSGDPIGPKSDVWALGCILFKMCFLIGPFEEAGKLQIINAKFRIPASHDYSNNVIDLIKAMLTVSVAKRPDVFQILQKVCQLTGISYNQPKVVVSSNSGSPVPNSISPTSNAPQTPTKTPSSTGSQQSGDLFSMLDWYDDGGKSATPASSVKPQQPAKLFEDDWSADFTNMSVSKPATSKLRPPSPKQHSRIPSGGSPTAFPPQQTLQAPKQSHVRTPSFETLRQPQPQPQPSATVYADPSSPDGDLLEEDKKKSGIRSLFGHKHSPNNSAADGQSLLQTKPALEANPSVGNIKDSLQVATTSNLHVKWVVKATSFAKTEPKQKYVRRIILDLWKTKSISSYTILFRARPIFSSSIVCFKMLTTLHHIIQDAPATVLEQLKQKTSLLADIIEVWNNSKKDIFFSRAIIEYATYLQKRLEFHSNYAQFEPNFALEQFLRQNVNTVEATIGKEPPFTIQVAQDMIGLLKSIDTIQKIVFQDKTNSTKLGCLVPLIYDAQDIYQCVSYVIFRIVKKGLSLGDITASYNGAYRNIYAFIIMIKTVKPVASVVTLLDLKPNPPPVSTQMIEPPRTALPPDSKNMQFGRSKGTPTSNDDVDSDYEDDEEQDLSETSMYSSGVTYDPSQTASLEECLKIEGNGSCAECRMNLNTTSKWASINVGIFICNNCSGLHRGLGVHISKVKSVTLDKWTQEQIQFMKAIGNKKANEYWEADMPADARPKSCEETEAMKQFLNTKYVEKKWVVKGRQLRSRPPQPTSK